MDDRQQIIQEAPATLQSTPTEAGHCTLPISLVLGLPIVGIVIFGIGLWLGYWWRSPVYPVPAGQQDTSLTTVLQQQVPAPHLTSATNRHRARTPLEPGAFPEQPSSLNSPVFATAPGGLSTPPHHTEQSKEVSLEPDAEGWRVIKDSTNPEDFAAFLAAFPESRYAEAAHRSFLRLQPHTPGQSVPSEVPAIAGAEKALHQVQRQVPSQMSSLQVRYAQMSLRVAGFDPGPADGIYGLQTFAAVRQYQARHDLPVTGKLDTVTREALLIPPHAVLEALELSRRTDHTPLIATESSHKRDQQTRQSRLQRTSPLKVQASSTEALFWELEEPP